MTSELHSTNVFLLFFAHIAPFPNGTTSTTSANGYDSESGQPYYMRPKFGSHTHSSTNGSAWSVINSLLSPSSTTTSSYTNSSLVTTFSSLVFFGLVVIIPLISIFLCTFHHSFLLIIAMLLASLSTAYAVISTFIFAWLLCQSLNLPMTQINSTPSLSAFPPNLFSTMIGFKHFFYLYALIGFTFSMQYYTIMYAVPDSFVGLSVLDGWFNVIHCTYFSISVLSSTGFGDVIATGSLARLFVCLQLVVGMIVNVLIFGKGIDIIASRREQLREDHKQK